MSSGRVAVVIRCRNGGRTLDAAMDSVRRQTRPPEQLLVLDHASDDIYTRQALARHCNDGLRIIAVAGSEAAARNVGTSATTAEYIVLLDADAGIATDYLEHAASRLDDDPGAGFVAAGAEVSTDVTSWLARTPPHSASMFRRTSWSAVGGFDESAGDLHVLDFWLSLTARGWPAAANPSPAGILPPSLQTTAVADPELLCFARLVATHAATLCLNAEDLIVAHERTLLTLRDRRAAMDADRHQLQTDLGELHREIDDTLRALQRYGRSRVEFGDLRQVEPLSPVWGLDRGKPLDRHYIESFLARHRDDIRGAVLEVKDPAYTVAFGGDRVTRSDVVDIDAANPRATVIADLTSAALPANSYDCFILTQTLGVIYDVRAALQTAYRVLTPGGVLLCTLPASGRISYEGAALDGDFWRFTEASTRRLFAEVMPVEDFDVIGFGNVLASTAFLYGLAPHELSEDELNANDPFFPIVYGVRAVKRTATE